MQALVLSVAPEKRLDAAYEEAAILCDEDVAVNEALGDSGLPLIRDIWERNGKAGPVRVLTHCNAGWLATVDWGTALAPIYKAHGAGIPVHVWVDETRPRSQGASLTAWELAVQGIEHSLIVDNAGGHLMQHGLVDICIVGTDRTAASGDVCNKIGTYLKALAARDNNVPFYVALPSSTIDWSLEDGFDIPIEERSPDEVLWVPGKTRNGVIEQVRIAPEATPAVNPAFDVTPAEYVTGLITERGVCGASREGLAGLFPERAGL
jgi:methylthioribose-1-phosphate isomerase